MSNNQILRKNGTNAAGNEMGSGAEECDSRFKCHGAYPGYFLK